MRGRRANHKKNSTWREGNTLVKKSSIVLGMLNVNGWNEIKKHDVMQAMDAKNVDVFSIIETKKKPHSKKIEIPGFKIFETRRKGDNLDGGSDKEGGGLACAVRSTTGVSFSKYDPVIKYPELNYVGAERLWVKYCSSQGKTAIGTIYCGFQASDNRHLQWNEGIYKVLSEEIRDLRGQGYRVLVQGDYNAWIGNQVDHGGLPGNRSKVTPNGELFLSFVAENNLINVNGATRQLNGRTEKICSGLWTRHASDYVSSSVLDYVVVSEEHLWTVKDMMIDQDGALGGGSDHNMIISRWQDKFISIPKVQPFRRPGWNIEGADWEKFRKVVQLELDDQKIETNNINTFSEALTRMLVKGLNSAAGKRSTIPPKRTLYPRHIVNLLNERKALEKVFKSAKSRYACPMAGPSASDSLIIAKDNLDAKTDELNAAKSKFESQKRGPLLNLARSKGTRNRRKFWDYVNRKTKKSNSIPPLQDQLSGILKHSPQDIADEVSCYLKDIFSGSDHPLSHENNDNAAPHNSGSQARMDSRTNPRETDISATDSTFQPPMSQGQPCPILNNPGSQARMDSRSHSGEGDANESDASAAINSSGSQARMDSKDHVRDHEYCANPNPRLPSSSGSSGFPDDDPSGYLDKDFSVDEVAGIIRGLGNGKAAGYDDIINEALKEAPPAFIRLLTKLYNMVKSKGEAPKAWKRGRIVLIHKKGSESNVSNYRPLTVIPSMCGTFSKLLNSRLTEVVEQHRLLGETQNGFRKDRSGIDSAFILNSILWKCKAKRKTVNLAFLDLQKAYDSVCRETLWAKLAKLGFGGQFLESIKSLYDGDSVTSDVNGVTTKPVYLGRGLRQGCSLSPMLFALYISDMSRDLHDSKLGVLLNKVVVSCLLFADDIVLVARDADGLRQLRDIVQLHCVDLNMTLSVSKSKVMSASHDLWELLEGDTIIGTLEKVLTFKYLGVETKLNPRKSAAAMMDRAKNLAKSYRKTCISLANDGPDTVDLTLCLWQNIAMPSILYGCEIVPFSASAIDEIERHQSSVGKFTLGLPPCAPNISATSILGIPTFKELLYSTQLKYLARLLRQDPMRWSKDAFIDHLQGDWPSPYLKYLGVICVELGLQKWPTTPKEIDVSLKHHFLEVNNDAINHLSLPALKPLNKRARMDFSNESRESQVSKLLRPTNFLLL